MFTYKPVIQVMCAFTDIHRGLLTAPFIPFRFLFECLESKEERGDGQRVFYILDRKQKHKEDNGSGSRAKD